MAELINFLNNNQGVLGLLSLLVTILGFFFVNKNIKVLNQQSQKSGDNAVNQQAQNGGVAQNAGRDTINRK